MSPCEWSVRDAGGREIARSEVFDSRAAAEEWMAVEWAGLAEHGGDSVALECDGETVYEMGLGPGEES